MSHSDPSDIGLIEDLIRRLEAHMSNGFDGRKVFLTDERRAAMRQLLSELRQSSSHANSKIKNENEQEEIAKSGNPPSDKNDNPSDAIVR